MSGRRRGGTLPAVSAAGVIEILKTHAGVAWCVDLGDDMELQPSIRPRRLKNGLSLRLVWRDRDDGASVTVCLRLDGWSPAMLLRAVGAPQRQAQSDA